MVEIFISIRHKKLLKILLFAPMVLMACFQPPKPPCVVPVAISTAGVVQETQLQNHHPTPTKDDLETPELPALSFADTGTVGMARVLSTGLALQPLSADTSGIDPLASADMKVRLKLLLLEGSSDDAGLPAIRLALRRVGVPFDEINTQTTNLSSTMLEPINNFANYQGIILSTPTLAYKSGTGYVSGLTGEEWNLLTSFERRYGLRRAVLTAEPSADIGLESVGSLDTRNRLSSLMVQPTTAGAVVFSNLNAKANIEITGATIYLGKAKGGQVLLQDANARVVAATNTTSDGREMLWLTMTQDANTRHSLLLLPGLVEWVTRGLHLGAYQTNLNIHVDDYFSTSDIWDVNLNRDVILGYRITAEDAFNYDVWQNNFRKNHPLASSLVTDMLFNGRSFQTGAATLCALPVPANTDGLSAATKCIASHFRWVNHTWSHPYLDKFTAAQINDEITKNAAVGRALGVSTYIPDTLVTGAHTGLGYIVAERTNYGKSHATTGLISSAAANGIRWMGTTSSMPTSAPECVSTFEDCNHNNPYPFEGLRFPTNLPTNDILVEPRYFTGVAWDVSTPEELTDQYNHLRGTSFSYEQIINTFAETMLTRTLEGQVNAWFLHQANIRKLTDGRTLTGDLLERFATKYEALLKLPIQNDSMRSMGERMLERTNLRNAVLEKGSLKAIWNKTTGQVGIAGTPSTLSVVLTNPKQGDANGTSYVLRLKPGTTLALTTPPVVPVAVSKLDAVFNNSNINLSWPAVTSAEEYQLERRENTSVYVALTKTSAVTYTDNATINPGSAYSYRIRASNAAGFSPWTESASLKIAPSAPSPLNATLNSDNSIALVWPAITASQSYQLERREESGPYLALAQTNTTKYSDTKIKPNLGYTYRVQATGTTGNSTWTESVIIQTPPLAPNAITAKLNPDNSIELNWSMVAGAVSYGLERKTNSENFVALNFVALQNQETNNHTDVMAALGSTYAYRVRAIGKGGPSIWTESATVTMPVLPPESPKAPLGFVVFVPNEKSTKLSWQTVANASSYEIERRNNKISNAEFVALVQLPSNSNLYEDTSVVPGTSYSYRLRAMNLTTAGLWSEANAEVPFIPLVAPSEWHAAILANDHVQLVWQAVIGASTYAIERRAANVSDPYVVLTSTEKSLSFTDTTVQSASAYLYRIRALGENAISPWSELSVSTPIVPVTPAPPEPTPQPPTPTPAPAPTPAPTPTPTPAPSC